MIPAEFEIELSADCNAACPLCARTMQGMPLRGNSNLTLADIKRIFPDADSIHNKIFKFVGVIGDPILNPECIEILEYIGKHDPKLMLLNTNAGYNTEEWWERLATVPNLDVEFSLDGHRETNHLYRVNTKWEIVERNFTAYMNAGGTGRWIYLMFEHNEHELDIALEHAKSLGMGFERRTSARGLVIPKVSKTFVDKKTKNTTAVVYNQSNLHQHDDQTAVKNTIRAAVKRNNLKLQEVAQTIKCKHLERNHVYIGSDLTVWPCCYLYDQYKWMQTNSRMQQDTNNRGMLSIIDNSLKYHTLEEILKSEFFVNLQDRWRADSDNFIFRCLKSCGNSAVNQVKYTQIIKNEKS